LEVDANLYKNPVWAINTGPTGYLKKKRGVTRLEVGGWRSFDKHEHERVHEKGETKRNELGKPKT